MKRLRMWIHELTLTQQLLCIIFAFIAVFAGFIFFFLAPAIEIFSETEMYANLHSAQNTVIDQLTVNGGSLPAEQEQENTDSILHLIYYPETGEFTEIYTDTIPDTVYEDIRAKAQYNFEGTRDYDILWVTGEQNSRSMHYLYTMTSLKDGGYFVSIIPDSYRNQFQMSMISGVILINVLVVSVLFVLLMIWVGSLIYPLSQIKAYVKKIKNDEPAVLNVRRNDEIGEVANALTEMERELSAQNRQKQEMIQNISHDLKTPIATIKSYSEAIKDGIYPYETLEKSCDVIIEHADRLEKKVKSLIVLNKMDYLLDECPEGDTLDMNRIIEKTILSLKVVRPEIELCSETEEGILFHGEEEPWRITIENLIENALRYAKTRITVTLKEGELCVINDGRQIEQDRLDSLFHPYEKGTDGQFGLGLSIVYRVCTTYGYHVQAENLPHGVCFRIWKDIPRRKKKNNQNSKDKAQDRH